MFPQQSDFFGIPDHFHPLFGIESRRIKDNRFFIAVTPFLPGESIGSEMNKSILSCSCQTICRSEETGISACGGATSGVQEFIANKTMHVQVKLKENSFLRIFGIEG